MLSINFSVVSAMSSVVMKVSESIRRICLSPVTGKKIKPSNNSAVCDQLPHCNFLCSFDNFSVLHHENKKYVLKIKESLLIMIDQPSLFPKWNKLGVSEIVPDCRCWKVDRLDCFGFWRKNAKKNCPRINTWILT